MQMQAGCCRHWVSMDRYHDEQSARKLMRLGEFLIVSDWSVPCVQAGRYPHLVKTDSKHDGLNVYQLDEGKVPPSVAVLTAKALQLQDTSDGSGEPPSGASERSSE